MPRLSSRIIMPTIPRNSTSDVLFLHSPNNGRNAQCVDPQGRAFSTNNNKGAYEEVRERREGKMMILSLKKT